MSELKYKIVEADSLKMEERAKELMSAPEMQPYLRYAEAVMTKGDVAAAVREIAGLPLDTRYLWRMASELNWGFADFDDWSIILDMKTLSHEDGDKVMQLLRLNIRSIQFCMMLKVLLGAEEMERMMNEGISVAKQG